MNNTKKGLIFVGLASHQKSFLLLLQISLLLGLFGDFSHAAQTRYSQAELDWLAKNPVVNVAVSSDYAPISYISEKNQFVGLTADYLARIEKQIKVVNPQFHFNTVLPKNVEKLANNPLEKHVLMVADFVDTPERQKYWQFTKPYLEMPLHLIVRENSKLNTDLSKFKNEKIAVVDYYAAHEVLTASYPNLKLSLVSANQEGLKKVAFGEVSGFVTDLPVASYWASKAGLTGLKDAGELPYNYQISLASSRKVPLLHGILEKSLAEISLEARQQMHGRWFVGPFISKPLLKDIRVWLILVGLLCFAIAAFWLKNNINRQNERLTKQQNALAWLTQNQLRAERIRDDVFKDYTKVAANTLDVERVSIWLFDDTFQQLECVCLYAKSQDKYLPADPLQAKDLPNYFREIADHRVIAVDNAMRHPFTEEFAHGYLQENNIGALLDSTIRMNGRTIGVVCHEHVGGTRRWTADEQNFAGSIADLSRITIETCKRRQVESNLLLQQKNIETIVNARTALIQRNAELFRFLVARAPVSILYMNMAHEIIEINPEAERIFGYKRAFSIGKTYQELFGTDDNKQLLENIHQQVVNGEKIQGQEIKMRRADATTIDVSVSCSMELDEDGNPMIISIGQDLTRQKAFELNAKKLLESEKRYNYVLQHAPIPILVLKKNGEILEVNPEAAAAFGAHRRDMIGKNFVKTIVAAESRKKAVLMAARTLKGEMFRDVELMLQTNKGEKFAHLCSIGMVTDDEDKELGEMVAIAQNISQQKSLQAILVNAREAAESADRIKSMFVASMSHELRTPLNSIIGFLGVVLQGMSGELNVKQKDQLSRAYNSSKHLLSLITDVIDISKIEAGFLQVYVEKFKLIHLFNEIQHAVQHLAEEKDLHLVLTCPDGIHLETDRKRLYQVVLNVVSNALKYTEQGIVNVSASIKAKNLIIVVEDTGIGIDAAGLEKLFKPFERIESHLKIRTLGTGLGLYLTRKILAQLLGGEISVVSQIGRGSTFTIRLPIKLPEIVIQNHTSILEDTAP